MQPLIRGRYAPSPTGDLHLGNLRTALLAWLFARCTDGQFVLRIEDLDRPRMRSGASERMLFDLRWLGIDWDEGPDIGGPHAPYIQSERNDLGIYKRYAEQLLASGHAYKSFVTEQELEQMRADAAARGVKAFRYRGAERDWPLQQVAEVE